MAIASPVYPVGLLLAGRSCLVVGGGRVALRKVTGLLDAGAEVTVVAPEAVEELHRLPVRLERRQYRAGEVAAYHLVITATGDPEVDRAVLADGEAAGVFVNSADDPEGCSFILPAILRRGTVTVAVSTAGASPALASWLRDRLAADLGDEVAELAALVAATRQRVRASGRSSEGLAWPQLIDELAALLGEGRSDEAAARAGGFAAGPE